MTKCTNMYKTLRLVTEGAINKGQLFWGGRATCEVLAPQPGTESEPLAVKAPSPNHWTTKELWSSIVLIILSLAT